MVSFHFILYLFSRMLVREQDSVCARELVRERISVCARMEVRERESACASVQERENETKCCVRGHVCKYGSHPRHILSCPICACTSTRRIRTRTSTHCTSPTHVVSTLYARTYV